MDKLELSHCARNCESPRSPLNSGAFPYGQRICIATVSSILVTPYFITVSLVFVSVQVFGPSLYYSSPKLPRSPASYLIIGPTDADLSAVLRASAHVRALLYWRSVIMQALSARSEVKKVVHILVPRRTLFPSATKLWLNHLHTAAQSQQRQAQQVKPLAQLQCRSSLFGSKRCT